MTTNQSTMTYEALIKMIYECKEIDLAPFRRNLKFRFAVYQDYKKTSKPIPKTDINYTSEVFIIADKAYVRVWEMGNLNMVYRQLGSKHYCDKPLKYRIKTVAFDGDRLYYNNGKLESKQVFEESIEREWYLFNPDGSLEAIKRFNETGQETSIIRSH